MRPSSITRQLAGLSLLVLLVTACGDAGEGISFASRSSADSQGSWALSESPELAIGVLSGEAGYQFDDIRWVSALEGGRIGVVDGGSVEARVFDSSGTLEMVVGGRGDGPGEFRSPWALHGRDEGGIQVVDVSGMRVSAFAETGRYIRSHEMDAADPMYRLDQWYYGRNYVQARVGKSMRSAVNRAVDALPPLDETTIFRWVILSDGWHLWTTDERPGSGEGSAWTVFDLNGRDLGSVHTPPGFTPDQVGRDFVLGVFEDELGVQYVHRYALRTDVPSGSQVEWIAQARTDGPDEPASTSDFTVAQQEALMEMRGFLRMMLSNQEIYYATSGGYTGDFEGLKMELPANTRGEIMGPGHTGWMAVLDHSELGVRCYVVIGKPGPSAPVPRGFGGLGRTLCMAR